jgi:hypothetical protein
MLAARDRRENLDLSPRSDGVSSAVALDLVAVHEQLHELVDAAGAVEDQLVEAAKRLPTASRHSPTVAPATSIRSWPSVGPR